MFGCWCDRRFFLTGCGEFPGVGRRRRSRCGTQELIELFARSDGWAPGGAVGAAVMGLVPTDPYPSGSAENPTRLVMMARRAHPLVTVSGGLNHQRWPQTVVNRLGRTRLRRRCRPDTSAVSSPTPLNLHDADPSRDVLSARGRAGAESFGTPPQVLGSDGAGIPAGYHLGGAPERHPV